MQMLREKLLKLINTPTVFLTSTMFKVYGPPNSETRVS